MEKVARQLPKTKLYWAITLSVLSSLLYAIMLSIARFSLSGFTMNQVIFGRSVVVLLFVLASIACCKKEKTFVEYLSTKCLRVHLIRSLTTIATIYLLFFSLKTISTAEANLLLNTAPIFIPFIAYLWKKSPMDPWVWPGIICAFAGIFCLVHPQGLGYAGIGVWAALLGGVFGSISLVALRLAHYSEPFLRIIFYYAFASALISGLLNLVEDGSWSNLANPQDLYGLLLVGGTGFLYQVLSVLSFKLAPVRIMSPFAYVSVIFSLLLDFIVWKTSLLPIEIVGMALVLSGLCLIVFLFREKKEEPKRSAPHSESETFS
jgi:drug/metabolite transporter (DMT)-like permease